MTNTTIVPDYLVVFTTGNIGSWGRGKSVDEAIETCKRLTRADWGKELKLKGKKVKLGVYNLTGRGTVSISPTSVWDGDEAVPLLKAVEVTL